MLFLFPKRASLIIESNEPGYHRDSEGADALKSTKVETHPEENEEWRIISNKIQTVKYSPIAVKDQPVQNSRIVTLVANAPLAEP